MSMSDLPGQEQEGGIAEPLPTVPRVPMGLLLGGHVATWILAATSAKVSRVAAELAVQVAGTEGGPNVTDPVRAAMATAMTDFKGIALAGTLAATIVAMLLRRGSPAMLRRITMVVALGTLVLVLRGFGP